MRRVSKKRAALIRIYMKRRTAFLERNPWCIRCGGTATEVHHAAGRIGDRLLDETTWRGACHDCHVQITSRPQWAYEMGYSLRRIGSDT